MCTFKGETAVQVCDVAIPHVKAQLAAGLGASVRYTHLEGEGTLVETLGEAVDQELFKQLVLSGMAAAETG